MRSSPRTPGTGGRCGSTASSPSRPRDHAGAISSFNTVYGQIPGELAPKLALAVACERAGDDRRRPLPVRDLCRDRRRLHRAGPVRSRPPRRSGRRLDGALDALGGHRPHQPGLDRRQGSPSPTARHERRAGPATWRHLDAGRPASTRSRGTTPTTSPSDGCGCSRPPSPRSSPSGDRSGAQVAGRSATEVDLRRALESTWRAAAQHSEDRPRTGFAASTGRTPSARGRWCDRIQRGRRGDSDLFLVRGVAGSRRSVLRVVRRRRSRVR